MVETKANLIPNTPNQSPDYYCTWQTQLYASNNKGVQEQRDIMNEKSLFGDEFPYGWANFYPDAREDLIFILDDSWDVPYGATPKESNMYGSLILDKDRFPSFADTSIENRKAIKKLSDAIKGKGWRGMGGWVCAQESSAFLDTSTTEYWESRIKDANYADLKCWKVDWGKKAQNPDFRLKLTKMAREYAPNLTINNAMIRELIPQFDVYRTYDVPAIVSIPMKMDKLSRDLVYDATEGSAALIDCEDEVYLAAALGCTFGVMRHPMKGNLPDGNPDPSFPNLHRNIKTKIDEVTRAARWHRIAPAFAVNGSQTHISKTNLKDTWLVKNQTEEIEAWWKYVDGDIIEKSAPSAICRGIEIPTVLPDAENDIPFIVAAKNPNGAVSIATLGRTLGRVWKTPRCKVSLQADDASIFGIFGEYESLEIHTSALQTGSRILAQDLLSDTAFDITDEVNLANGKIKLTGELISAVGTFAKSTEDTSEPGLVLKIENKLDS